MQNITISKAENKDTKSGILPKGWNRYRVRDVGQVQTGRQRSPNFTKGKLRPYLRVANIFEGFIDTSDVLQMMFTDEEFERYSLQEGDILLNEGQSIELVGRCAKYKSKPSNCCFQNTLVRFRSNGKIKHDFALILFTHAQKSGVFKKIASRTTSIAHLGVSRFANLQIFVPPISEQKKIADILSYWTTAVIQTHKLISLKKKNKKALMQRLFFGKYEFNIPNRVHDDYPDNWQIVKIKELFAPIKRKNTEGCDRILTASAKSGLIDQNDYFNRSVGATSLNNYLLLKKGDFAYNRSSMKEYAYGAIKRLDSYQQGILSTLYICFSLIDRRNNSDFYKHFFENDSIAKELSSIVQVGARAHGLLNISLKDFLQIKIPHPPLKEQLKIAKVLNKADSEIVAEEKKLKLLEKQKRGLMQKLLTGEVRVTQ